MASGHKSHWFAMATVGLLPRWDLSPFFPSIQSPEFVSAQAELNQQLAQFERLLVSKQAADAAAAAGFEEVLTAFNGLLERFNLLFAFVEAFTTTDSNDQTAAAKESELDAFSSRLQAVRTRLVAWLGTIDPEELAHSVVAKDHQYFLVKAREQSRRLMSPAEEALAAKLAPTGGVAWAKLHGNVTSRIEVDLELPTGTVTVPMSQVRNYAYDPDPSVRRIAYDAELAAWKEHEVSCAAAMNSIKGEVGLLAELRGWNSPLDESLFVANIDRLTLDAMMGAAKNSFPDFRRYLQAKAKLLGKNKLPWYDLFAPIGQEQGGYSYDKACAIVERRFRQYSPKMGDFAARAFAENWVDAEPRVGKRDGAYCEGFNRDVSRIFMNFKPSFGSVSTLAHELGHGYHNLCLDGLTALQREIPMTLAETASIFCETILKKAALAEMDESQCLPILESALQGSCQVVVDIASRFLFESQMFTGRKTRELSAQEMCEAMIQAQKDTYGEGMDTDRLHPYMWAVKPHYYSAGLSFYNYPYMFGLLFGLGLFAIYEQEPDSFKSRYDGLLRRTGLNDAASLAAEFDIDIRSSQFWQGSLSVIKKDIDRFVRLVG